MSLPRKIQSHFSNKLIRSRRIHYTLLPFSSILAPEAKIQTD